MRYAIQRAATATNRDGIPRAKATTTSEESIMASGKDLSFYLYTEKIIILERYS